TATVTDNAGRGGVSTPVSVIVNNRPIAVSDRFLVYRDAGTNELEVLLNDSDPDGQALAVNSIASLATNGTAYVSGGRLFYGPNPANNLIHDFFSYSVADTYGALATGTVSIAILPSKYAIVTPIYTTNQIVSPTNQVETTSPVTITGI